MQPVVLLAACEATATKFCAITRQSMKRTYDIRMEPLGLHVLFLAATIVIETNIYVEI